MSIRQNGNIIAGISTNTIYNAHTLFDFKWSDYLLDDMNWLRADTFSWQYRQVYTTAYNHLVSDVIGKTLQSETISGITIQYYLADDGHKICPASQENNVLNLYNTVGAAWYYILDTASTSFKLPRTKYGFVGLRDNVGKYIPESLPNITGGFHALTGAEYNRNSGNPTGSFTGTRQNVYVNGDDSAVGDAVDFTFNASRSSSTYQDGAPVQQRSTQMYLYFYVGQFSQTATEQTAGLNAELFNNKADINLANVTSSNTNVIDGQWVNSYLQVANGVTWDGSTQEATYSLTSYLPNDNNSYEVIVKATATSGTTVKNFVTVGLTSDIITSQTIALTEARTQLANGNSEAQGSCIIPVGTGRYIKQYSTTSANANGNYTLRLCGYRRIGTNS